MLEGGCIAVLGCADTSLTQTWVPASVSVFCSAVLACPLSKIPGLPCMLMLTGRVRQLITTVILARLCDWWPCEQDHGT